VIQAFDNRAEHHNNQACKVSMNATVKPMKNNRFPIHLALLSLLLGVFAAAPARAAKLAPAINIDLPSSSMVACGGGGSGAYRKPPRPADSHISSVGATSASTPAVQTPNSNTNPTPTQPLVP
jgi:hypothetical protein